MSESRNIWLVVLVILLLSCTDANTAKVDSDESLVAHTKYTVDIDGRITSVVKSKGNFYCLVESDYNYSGKSLKQLYLLDSKLEALQKIQVPEEVNDRSCRLMLRRDSILMKNSDKRTFYFDPTGYGWTLVSDMNDPVFEDSRYRVYAESFGEYGSSAWFKNKETGIEYALATTSPTINVCDSVYYVSANQSVYKIDDPSQLPQCDSTEYYREILKSREHFWFSSRKGSKGSDTLYLDRTNWEESKLDIVTSLISKDTLLVVYADSIGIHLGNLENGRVVNRETLMTGLKAYDIQSNYRIGQFSNMDHLVILSDENWIVKGILDISEGQVNVMSLANVSRLPIIGKRNANSQIGGLINFSIENAKSVNLQQLSKYIEQLNGKDVSPSHRISIGSGLYPNRRGFDLETPRVFKVIEDSTITLFAEYFYTKHDNSVKVSDYVWKQTKELNYGISRSKDHGEVKGGFEARLEAVIESISKRIGDPVADSSDSGYTSLDWETADGTKVSLRTTNFSKQQYEITLRLYNE